jgi:hypothetical protein
MKSKPHQRSFAALAAAFLLAPAHGQIQLNYPLGESDPGAVAAAAGNATTVDTIGANDLSIQGSGTVYSSNVPAAPSTLSVSLDGNGHYAATGQGFYSGLDLGNFEASVDVYPTAVGPQGFSIAMTLGHNGAGSLFLYHVGNGGTWRLHSNGNGDRISGGTVTFNQWQTLRIVRTGGVMSLFVDGVSVGSTPNFTSTGNLGDSLTIGANTQNPATFQAEGRFVGQIDNVMIGAPDDDGDGLPNAWEIANGLDPNDDGTTNVNNGATGDPDLDTFDNLAEFTAGSNPQVTASTPTDTDADALADEWEEFHFQDLDEVGGGDPDGDFSTNEAEETADTDPTSRFSYPDSDLDDLPDGWEVHFFAEPGDTLGQTLARQGTFDDADDDDFVNLVEYDAETDPTDPQSTPDTDGDGLPNSWEIANGLDPDDNGSTNVDNGTDGDPDGDGASNFREFQFGTDPQDENDTPPANPTGHVWQLGELDAGAVDAGALNATGTANGSYRRDLTLQGTGGSYSSEVPAGGSTLSASFNGSQIYSAPFVVTDPPSATFFAAPLFDFNNWEMSADVRPTAAPSFHIAFTIGSNRGGDGGAGRNYFVYHTGTTWNVHSNTNGNFDTGLPVTLNGWQKLRLVRSGGVTRLHVDAGVSAPVPFAPTTFNEVISIGGNRDDPGFEGGFIGQIDNVSLSVPLPSPTDADGDGLLDTWELANGLLTSSGAGVDGPAGDPDGDGETNADEFAFGGNAQVADSGARKRSAIDTVSGTDHLTLTLALRAGTLFSGTGPLTAQQDGINYEIRGSYDLSAFAADVTEVVPALSSGLPAAPDGYSYRTFRLSDDTTTRPKGFLQGRASLVAP